MDMDFTGLSSLRVRMNEDQEARNKLISRLYYLVTIAAEDAAMLAVEGQGGIAGQAPGAPMNTLRDLGERIEIIALAIEALVLNRTEE